MAKKVQRYSKYSLKIFNHSFDNLTVKTYVLGNGPKKVFLFSPIPHSGMLMVKFLEEEMLDQLTLISFDIPGWTGEKYLEPEYTPIYKLVNISKSIAKYLKLKKYSVVGIEYGASIVTSLVNSEDRIESVVLINPVFKRSLVSGKYRMLCKLIKRLNLGQLVKNYYISQFRIKSKILLSDMFDQSILNVYMHMLNSMDSKVIGESIYRYYNTDLSLHLNRLVQSKLLVLYKEDLYNQVEYLRRVVGRENVESYLITKNGYPFQIDTESVKRIEKFLLDKL